MKKLFIVFAIASLGFVACNSAEEAKTDAPAPTETVAPEASVVDTTAAPVDTTAAPADTTAAPAAH